MRSAAVLLIFTCLLITITSCSKDTIPVTPSGDESLTVFLPDEPDTGESNRQVIAAYIVTIDPINETVTLEPIDRIGNAHFNLTNLVPHVAWIMEAGRDPKYDNNFYVDIRINHPYPGSGIDAFDPRVIAVLPATHAGNSVYFPAFNVIANNRVVMEPDGYTKLFDKQEISGNTNPFKAYFKDQLYRRWSSDGPLDETIRWYLDLDGFSGALQYFLICDVSTGHPQPPEPIQHNAPDPVEIWIDIDSQMASNGGYADLEITIMDWKSSGYVIVGVESPQLFDSYVNLDLIKPGDDPHTYIYEGKIVNTNLAPAGEYFMLINVFDGFSARGIYQIATVTVQDYIEPSFENVHFDFSTVDIKQIHVTGRGFGNDQGDSIVFLNGETSGFTVAQWDFHEIAIAIPNDNLDHTLQFEINSVLYDEIHVPESEAIFLIYNADDSDSVAVKDYYASDITGRNIGDDMILGLDLALPEEITRTQYNDYIRDPIETHILQNDLKYRIKYIVLCHGIPLKIKRVSGSNYNDLDYAAVDSELTLIFNGEYNLAGRKMNPYYAKTAETWFHPFKFKWGGDTMAYLVTRLAGWDLEDILGMIDRGLNPYSGSDAYALLDGRKPYDRMGSAAAIYDDLGFNYLFDNGDVFLSAETIDNPSISDFVIAYTGHGVHHNPSPPGGGMYVYHLDFTLLNGAIFNTYESFNCTTFIEDNRSGHGNVGDWIRIGGTGGIGHVYEPWSDAVGDERYLYPRQFQKHNLAEACYMSLRYLSWTETVVGDPLCIIDVQL